MQQIDEQLQRIKDTLLMMVSLADRNFTLAIRALLERDSALSDTVEAEDSQLDQLEVSIDDEVVVFIVRHRPVAHDLRLAMVASHISRHLERIGDQAVSVARLARVINGQPQLKPLIDIPRMANVAIEMMRDAIDGFVNGDSDKMQDIVRRDRQVDEINRQLFRELTSFMIESPSTITRALHLVLVARAIERAADHCKAIAEEVFYLNRAVDIRHSARPANASGVVAPDEV